MGRLHLGSMTLAAAVTACALWACGPSKTTRLASLFPSGPSDELIKGQIRSWYNDTSAEFMGQKLGHPGEAAALTDVIVKKKTKLSDDDYLVSTNLPFMMKATYAGGPKNTPMVLLVDLGFEDAPGKSGEIKTLGHTFEFAKVNGQWALQQYRALDPSVDNMLCAAEISSMSGPFDGPPDGTLTDFKCVLHQGVITSIPLASRNLVKGELQTQGFGVVRLKGAFGHVDYYMTDNQIRKIKSYLSSRGTQKAAN